jgi:hypothetical protein
MYPYVFIKGFSWLLERERRGGKGGVGREGEKKCLGCETIIYDNKSLSSSPSSSSRVCNEVKNISLYTLIIFLFLF